MKILIFAGTTEGRQLSDMLDERHIAHTVSVVSEYGSDLISKNQYTKILTGRMDAGEMKDMLVQRGFTKDDTVVDATHPYAEEVSRNIRDAVAAAGCNYVRIGRDGGAGTDADVTAGVHWHDTPASCAYEINSAVNGNSNILLTTGSKELHDYCAGVSEEVLAHTYVRVLPSVDSIELCKLYRVPLPHIIAMQGPFSYELNRAIMEQYNIGILVTKDSGTNGGFREKVQAALDLGIDVHVIRRPADVQGVSVDEAYEIIVTAVQNEGLKPVYNGGSKTQQGKSNDKDPALAVKTSKTDGDDPASKVPDHPCRNIILCGCGMGTVSCMTGDVKEAIINADAVFGSKRMLELALDCRNSVRETDKGHTDVTQEVHCGISDKNHPLLQNKGNLFYEKYLARDIIPILESNADIKTAVILFSGDSGFYSGAGAACGELSKWDGNAQITMLPGISSVSYLASKLRETYEDAVLLSLHGRSLEDSMPKLLETVRYNRKTFLLLSGSRDINTVAEWLDVFDINCVIYAGSNLSYDYERIDILKPTETVDYNEEGMVTALIINEECERKPVYRTFKDDDFIRDKVPMTKECIRHESILRFSLKSGDVVYDIGGGTGSVAIEIAAQDPSIRVYTFERKEEAAKLIEKNLNLHGALNVKLIKGEAPEAFKDIEAPDCVFIGGSAGRLDEIIGYLSDKKSGIRYVANAVSLETIEEIRHVVDRHHATEVSMIQISVNNIETVGSHHLFKAQNPVTIFSFVIRSSSFVSCTLPRKKV
ncbi:MAG: precorrin-6A reductase [Lachnospiraceae bacterium]|nr:precorrin-6A reductase [Lachnospiraceae bacterium]